MKGSIDTSRRRYHHSNLPDALRVAARAILDESGADAVGLRETSRRVGVSATAAYRHFNNKQDLLASVAAEGFRELAAAMERGATDRDTLPAVGLAYVDFALQKRGLFRLMFGPILVERAKYPELNEAANAVFNLLRRVEVGAEPKHRPVVVNEMVLRVEVVGDHAELVHCVLRNFERDRGIEQVDVLHSVQQDLGA